MSVDMKDYLAYQEGYEAGKRDAAPRWHRVEEELPNKDEFVLAYEDGTIVMASFDGSKWWQFDLYELIDIDPSHWCDLPEPPKEDA